MKKISLLFLSFAFFLQVSGQNIAPVGTTWYYTEYWAFSWPGEQSYIKVESVKDTVVLGEECTQVILDGIYCDMYSSTYSFLFERDSVAYFYNPVTGTFEILYDLKAVPGDHWKVIWPSEWCPDGIDSVEVTVDSTTFEEINGINLKVLYVTYLQLDPEFGWSYPGKIYERIGDDMFLFNYHTNCVICDANYPGGLRCYDDEVIGHYETGIADSCDLVYFVGIDEKDSEEDVVSVFPNPCRDRLTIEIKDDSKEMMIYELSSISGACLMKGSIMGKTELDLTGLKNGLYFLVVRKESGRKQAVKKIMKY